LLLFIFTYFYRSIYISISIFFSIKLAQHLKYIFLSFFIVLYLLENRIYIFLSYISIQYVCLYLYNCLGQTKVYNCCLCGKMLSSFSSLDRHMLVHSGERPFSCEVCAQTFTTNGNMHRHRRTHNVRDSCESDGSAGSGTKRARKRKAAAAPVGQDGLQSKISVDESKYSLLNCPICPEKFYSDISLDVHMISLHPGRDVKCEECGHPCPSYNYYKLHRNMFHFNLGSTPVHSFPGSLSQTPYT